MATLDPRSPYVVDTREIGRRPGQSQRLQRTVPAPADMGTDVIAVPEGSDLRLQLLLESVVEGVLVSGEVHARAAGECVRCLDDVARDVDVRVQELYAYPGSSSADDEDLLELVGDHLDLEPLLRDAVVPALPFQPVCREDCPGLCPQCGARLADDPGHTHERSDPRWEALRRLADGSPGGAPGAPGARTPDDLSTTPDRPARADDPRS